MYVKGHLYTPYQPKLNKEDVQPFLENSRIKELNIKEVDFDIFKNKKWETINTPPVELKITRMPGEVDIYDYFSFIDDIPDFDERDKSIMYSTIQQSVNFNVNGIAEGKVFAIAQTSLELSIFSDKLIPEAYQEKMNQAIKSMETDRLDAYYKQHKSILEQFYKTMSSLSPPLKDSVDSLAKEIKQIEAATHDIQKAANQYVSWFNDIKGTDQFVQDYEQTLQKFEQMELKGSNDSQMMKIVNDIKEQMRNKWNKFAGKLQFGNQYQLSTRYVSAIDIKK